MNTQLWLHELASDEDEDFLANGITCGFQIVPASTNFANVDMDNYKSATNPNAKPLVEQTIRNEIAEGNYSISANKPTIVSALGAIPKPDSSEIRLIHDCSRPHGQAVNDYVTTDSFKYQTLDDALKRLRPNYYMAKIDLRHAYRSVPIHPSNYQATGCKWKFTGEDEYTYFYDRRLPFGAKSSPGIFHRLTQAVRRMMERRGFEDVIVYLDDFLVIGKSLHECQLAYEMLKTLLTDLGFQLSTHKLIPPTQRLVFLGVQLDTHLGEMTLPRPKLLEFQSLVNHFLTKRRANLNQLQKLAGKLNWACRVVFGGRTFLRRVLDMMNSLKSSKAKCRLSADFHDDLQWWVKFLQQFNGKRLFLDSLPTVDVQTDACPLAAGAFYRGDWFYHHFSLDSPQWDPLHINHKETLAIILAAKRWHKAWVNQHVIIHSDNQAAVNIINKGSTANRIIMKNLRELFWLSAVNNFRITARYIRGSQNITADAVSRLHNPKHCLTLYKELRRWRPAGHIERTPLGNHMSAHCAQFLRYRYSEPSSGLVPPGGNISV